MSKTALVSIITPCYQAARYLPGLLASVQAQQYPHWELWLVDDGSSDGTAAAIAEAAAADSRIHALFLPENQGAAAARNAGISAARGRYIAFLDVDDRWMPEKLQRQLDFMQRENIAFSYTYYKVVEENGRAAGVVDQLPAKLSYEQLLTRNFVGCLTAMYDSAQLGKVLMPALRKRQDYGLWLHLLKKTPYAYLLPEVLATYTRRESSLSSNKLGLIRYNWQLFRQVEGLSLLSACYYLSCNITAKLFSL
ncbi:glycosyltransferase [Nitritalea halalkaliphila LW7]|uniref:Glycosyltransferase n=1 Tax=Nitritalea halalkaliphila LW7 TaxID=1189621 RepID=I5BUL8_9BACT|nr:glycosyltransferase family 2 protein [Nitritalea halalkaliphila]EIM73270.1 glycosyltransferase [Nitritalea halalkaliphila LW7]